jgi:hypothetical protein
MDQRVALPLRDDFTFIITPSLPPPGLTTFDLSTLSCRSIMSADDQKSEVKAILDEAHCKTVSPAQVPMKNTTNSKS